MVQLNPSGPLSLGATLRPGDDHCSRVRSMQAVKGLPMEKWLCWGSMGVAGFLLFLFLLDLVSGFPFGRLNLLVDILSMAGCGLVLYLAWDAYKDLR
jgi:hypothetical protein